jgi:gas vesicle protein
MFVRRSKNAGKKMALSALLGGVAGYVSGILTAPKSGKETRKQIVEDAEGLKEDAEDQLKKTNDELKVLLKDAKSKTVALSAQAREEFNEAVIRAKDAQNKASTTLKAVKNGQADDPDLNKAVKQAKLAVKNLSKYFKG